MSHTPQLTPEAQAKARDATKVSNATLEQLKEGVPDADAR